MQVYRDSVSSPPSTSAAAPLVRGRGLVNALALSLGDVLGLGLALALVASVGGEALPRWAGGAAVVWVLGAHVLGLAPGWGLSAAAELKRLAALSLIVFTSTAAGLWLAGGGIGARDLAVLALAFVAAWVFTAGLRPFVRRILIRAGLWGVPAVVYGGGATGAQLVATLLDHPGYGYRPVGVVDDGAAPGERVRGVPVLGSAAAPSAPVAVLALPDVGRERLSEMLDGPLRAYRRVLIVPDLPGAETLWMTACDLGGALGLEVTRDLLSPVSRAGKRAFDLAGVLLSAPLWLPACAVIALAIWLEGRAHPLFLQRRVGLDGQPFTTWKFRTMRPDAEAVLQDALTRDPALRQEWETTFKLRRDPRVTRLGALLRKTSLDELPQLVNVLLGQMSLVGPRPLPPYHHHELPRHVQLLRERVCPGMTGLWQVSGRSASGNAGMERWDPYYVRNWSPWLDLVILLRTVQVVLRGSGAY
ncbi:exopolysaccharide biosynthesis polyprenyl glycosylphosphotransferase [Deinococcus sp. YIM 134068]|uniref:exopolysaccharide biosynthesis polyprenyl glycosylphosphotransferase n=1 Tax=Deinococcus lichenicola TaxID=3118910 RepID=UPI002F93BD9C